MRKVIVEAMDRKKSKIEKKEFVALDTFEITPEQKLLWETAIGKVERITIMRIRKVTEMQITNENNSDGH